METPANSNCMFSRLTEKNAIFSEKHTRKWGTNMFVNIVVAFGPVKVCRKHVTKFMALVDQITVNSSQAPHPHACDNMGILPVHC